MMPLPQRQQGEQRSLEQSEHGISLRNASISPQDEKLLLETLAVEDWTKGLELRFSPETHTISVFSNEHGKQILKRYPYGLTRFRLYHTTFKSFTASCNTAP
jgi:hypothetical protein